MPFTFETEAEAEKWLMERLTKAVKNIKDANRLYPDNYAANASEVFCQTRGEWLPISEFRVSDRSTGRLRPCSRSAERLNTHLAKSREKLLAADDMSASLKAEVSQLNLAAVKVLMCEAIKGMSAEWRQNVRCWWQDTEAN